MMQVFDLAKKRSIQFTATVAHSSPIFFGDQSAQQPDPEAAIEAFRELLERQLASPHPKDWFRAYFTEGLIDLLANKQRRVDCPAFAGFFFLDPQGRVFPCHILDEPIGRLSDAPFEKLVAQVPGGIEKYRCCPQQCWMTCTVGPEMKRRPWVPANWIAGQKLKRLFGRSATP